MKRLTLVVCLLVACNGMADEWLRTVKIAIEPLDDGQRILNLRFTPNKTVEYDMLLIECVYRQSLPWQDEQGRTTYKILEPVNFVYRRPSVKMVADLDINMSFRVPLSHARLADAFGTDTFKTNFPIVIDRLRIIAERGEARLWEQELQVPGTYSIQPRPPKAPPPDSKKKGKFGEVDLD
ncbi:MAG: hypothetical protein WCR06_01705 [bacterium]